MYTEKLTGREFTILLQNLQIKIKYLHIVSKCQIKIALSKVLKKGFLSIVREESRHRQVLMYEALSVRKHPHVLKSLQ